ncbi:serine hydrolase domain-containing protein [Streptomyces celluloflavus]|uniref:serine hydrolase domain-containing protein n=1 Tax=Streptomyces celluloflavus TaxID=58344 RepID=UPI00346090BC|nr:beta-lactamase family protein [Streptomyces celluloflavus]
MPGYVVVEDEQDALQTKSVPHRLRPRRPLRPRRQHRLDQRPQLIVHDPRSSTHTLTNGRIITPVTANQDVSARSCYDLIGRYLPDLLPGERGRAITVRMLLNHTSGIGDYGTAIFATPESLEDNRFHQFAPVELARLGLKAAPLGNPGAEHHYANTNYVIAGLLLQKATGEAPEKYITTHVIRRAGLTHTYFPSSPYITGPHAKMYEAGYGGFNPPRDFSVYNMSWAGTAGSLVSTMPDLNRFYRLLLGGGLLAPAQLQQMKTTVPIEGSMARYGLGLFMTKTPCGEFWGHNGLVLGAMTWSLSSPDGQRQISLGFNLTRYQKLNGNNAPEPSPIDAAMDVHVAQALCGTDGSPQPVEQRALPLPATQQDLPQPAHR